MPVKTGSHTLTGVTIAFMIFHLVFIVCCLSLLFPSHDGCVISLIHVFTDHVFSLSIYKPNI